MNNGFFGDGQQVANDAAKPADNVRDPRAAIPWREMAAMSAESRAEMAELEREIGRLEAAGHSTVEAFYMAGGY